MTDYMKEAERLRAAQSDAVMPLIGPLLDAWEGCSSTCREELPELDKYLRRINRAMEDAEPAALLAHIQCGAVPEGWQVVPKEPTREMCRAGLAERHDDLAKSIYSAMLAAAPDHFRDAAEMVADTEDNGFDLLHDRPHTEMPGCRGAKSLKVRTPAEVPMPEPDTSDISGYTPHALRTYGDAREAAGYARGLADGQGHCRRLTETDKAQAAAALRGEVKP